MTANRYSAGQPPKGLDKYGNPLPERVNGYLVTPPTRWTKADNGRTLPLNSAAWRKLRRSVLNDEPLCRLCSAQGLVVEATEVDHMRGAADNRRESLQPLCQSHHALLTAADMSGRPARLGCDASGNPINPSHHWNKAHTRPPGASGGHGAHEKSPAPEDAAPSGIPEFIANREIKP